MKNQRSASEGHFLLDVPGTEYLVSTLRQSQAEQVLVLSKPKTLAFPRETSAKYDQSCDHILVLHAVDKC